MSDEDFEIASLAEYLHLTRDQVQKLADRGKIPGRKVAGKWRFSSHEIHHWLEERIGLSDDSELAHMENALQRAAGPEEEATISIADMLPVEAIATPLHAKTRNRVITAMVDLAAETGWLWDPKKFVDAVTAREEMAPTALDNGVALLHPRRPLGGVLDRPFLALGITPQGIPFGGSRSLTDIFFLICSVDDRSHLRVLARLSRLISDPDLLSALRRAPDARAVHELIVERDAQLAM